MGDYLSRFTFYDVVGYLLPGAIGLVATGLMLSMIDPTWAILSPLGVPAWGTLILAAYLVGHVLQGVSGKILRRRYARMRMAKKMCSRRIEMAGRVLTPYDIVANTSADAIDAIDTLKLPSAEQDIYVARQGFYRGGTAAFALLGLVLLVAAILNIPSEAFNHSVSRLAAFIGGPTCLLVSTLFGVRYCDFVQYEIENGIATALRSTR